MKRKLTNNIGLKIGSVIVGILVWLLVVNIDNPIVEKSFVLTKVDLLNEAYIDDTGLVCLNSGEQPSVRVTLQGERKKLSRITSADIQLTADLQQAISLDTDPVMIPITATCAGFNQSNITVSPQNYSVRLEEKMTSEFMVAVNNGDSRPGRGYEIGSQTVSPEKVRITGPSSLMKKIDKVAVNVRNVEGVTQDVTESSSVVVIDKNGETLSSTAMKNLRFDNEGRVTVTTKLWKVRSDIKIEAAYSGEPAAGYVADSISTVPETVSVAGTAEALETLRQEGNAIRIEEETVDISGADADVEQKLNLSGSLSDGLKLTSGTSDEVLVTVRILPDGGKSFTIPTTQIGVINKEDDLQVSFEIDKIELRIKAEDGNEDDTETLDTEDIRAVIDVEDRDEGTYEIPVEISLPDGYVLIDEVSTEITISRVTSAENEE